MDFVKRLAATGEQLLEHADASAAAQAKDLRQGGHAVRAAADRLQLQAAALAAADGAGGASSSSSSSAAAAAAALGLGLGPASAGSASAHPTVTQPAADALALREELAAAGEVLRRAQESAAEREHKLERQLQRERQHHAGEVDALVARIRALEAHEKGLYAAQEQVRALKEQLDKVQAVPQSVDVMELEQARREAEDARAALNATVRESSARCSELERANLELSKELRRLGGGGGGATGGSDGTGTSAAGGGGGDVLITALENTRREFEDRLSSANDRRLAAEGALARETERCATLETELNRALALTNELRAAHAAERAQKDGEVHQYKKEAELLKAQMETLRHTTEANGHKVLEQRLDALSGHLEMKQRTIDSLRSEKTALESRLAQALQHPPPSLLPGSEVHAAAAANTLMAGLARSSLGERGADANRRAISRLPFFLDKPELARAMDGVDGVALGLGALLRAKPLVRLGAVTWFVCSHILLLHCLLARGGGGVMAGGGALRGTDATGV